MYAMTVTRYLHLKTHIKAVIKECNTCHYRGLQFNIGTRYNRILVGAFWNDKAFTINPL